MIDSHTHTRTFSPDAAQTLDELIRAALKRGLNGIAVTEHMDPDLDQGLMIFDMDDYMAAMKKAVTRAPDGFRLLIGMEAGYMPHLVPRFRDITQHHPLDVVIGSVHAMDGDDIYFRRDVFLQGRDAAYGTYLDLLTDMVRSGDWLDVVGHYDYVCRVSGYEQPKITYAEQPDRFDALFQAIIDRDRSLELNARSIRFFRQLGESDPLPDRDLLLRYRELGGTRVTLGSDSHRPEEVGDSFEVLTDLLRDTGFDTLTVFQNRRPIRIPLDASRLKPL